MVAEAVTRSASTPAPSPLVVREAQPAPVPPTRDPATLAVTVDAALSVGAVYRAISVIVTSVSQMALTVYRQGLEVKTLPSLVRQPNVNDTQSGFVEESVFSLAAHGEAFWHLHRAGPGEAVSSITVLDPQRMLVVEDGLGKVEYHFDGREIPRWRMHHLRLMRRPGTVKGLGPIQAARDEIAALIRLRAFAAKWTDPAGVPLGYLTTDLILSPDESAEFAEAWTRFLDEHGGIGVLSQGLDFKYVGANPAEAEFTSLNNAAVTNIARLFGIPAFYLLAPIEGSSMTYANLEQANLQFMQGTLSRYMNEIENALTTLTPRGQEVRFKEADLLRLDSKTLWETRKTMVDLGYTSGAELRADDGKAPIPALIAPKEQA